MAATDLERLVVQLSADLKGYENGLKRAQGITNQRLGAIQKKATASSSAIAASFVRTGAVIAGAFIASDVLRNVAQLSDAATRIDNALKVAGLSGAELEKVYQRLNKAAIANGAPIETLATLYGKAAQAQKELGVTTEELLGFTNNVALALRVAGTDAQSASGALLQLGQALGSGKVQAEEFNSILEGAPTIAQAVAAGLEEAGGSVSRLKQLVVDGKISSEAFFRAFEAGAPILQEKVATSVFTIEQATTNLWTALTDVTREFNNSTGATESFAGGISTAAQAINDFDVSGLIQKIRDAKSELDGFLNDLGNAQIFKDLNEAMGTTDGKGNVINLDAEAAKDEAAGLQKEVEVLQERIALNTELGFDNTAAIARLNEVLGKLNEVRAAAGAMPATVPGYTIGEGGLKPTSSGGANVQVPFAPLTGVPPDLRGGINTVSVSDFKAPPGKGGGSGKGKKSGGGGGGSDDFQREIDQIKERTAAIQAETTAQAGLNPLLNDFGHAVEFASAKQDLLNAAKGAGKTITPELTAQIDLLAEGYASASASADKLAEAQEKVREQAEFFGDAAYDAFSELIPKIETGNKALDGFLNTLIEAVAQAALLGKGPFGGAGGAGGGLLGGLFSLFGFAKGGIASRGKPMKTFARGGVSRSAAIFGEAGPEAAVPLPDGRSIPVRFTEPSIPRRSSGGGSNVHVTVGVSADNNGNLLPFVENVSQKSVASASPKIISAANQQVVPTMAKYQNNKAGGEWR